MDVLIDTCQHAGRASSKRLIRHSVRIKHLLQLRRAGSNYFQTISAEESIKFSTEPLTLLISRILLAEVV
jgi:hypothetical protein